MKQLIFVLLLLVLVVSGVYFLFPTTKKSEDEQKIYSLIFSALSEELGTITIQDETSLDEPPNTALKDINDFISNEMPEVDGETLADFKKRNMVGISLTRHNVTTDDCKVMSESNISARIEAQNTADLGTILTVSQIGFNTTKTQALVYRGMTSGFGDGVGEYILFEKKAGVWLVKDSVKAWVM